MLTNYVNARGLMADAKFYESYSRFNEQTGKYETWEQSVDRVMETHKIFYKDKLNDELLNLIEEATDAYKEKLVLGAQRSLQFGGDQLLKNNMKMYNCTSTYIDRPAAFSEIFWVLLCGAGVGFSVQKHHIAKLPDIQERKKSAKTFVVEDSIEGWADSVAVLMSSYFIGGGTHPEYEGRRVYFDLSNIRPRGAYISGGFKAPGPEPLRKALDKIEYLIQGRLLKGFTTLRPIDAYDIVMFIADAVLSGGVRRSATICLFSYEDEEMMTAKTGNWFIDNPQRARSNNSVVLIREETTREMFTDIFEKTKQFGEPGFAFFDSKEFSTNPCITADTIINTDKGLKFVRDLINTPFNAIVDGQSYPSHSGFVHTGFKSVYEISTVRGHSIRATDNHQVLINRNGIDQWVEVKDLVPGDEMVIGQNSSFKSTLNDQFKRGWIVGQVAGDGGHNPDKYPSYIRFWGDTATEQSQRAQKFLNDISGVSYKPTNFNEIYTIQGKQITNIVKDFLTPYSKDFTDLIFDQSDDFLAGLVQGYFDADGTVFGSSKSQGIAVRLCSNNKKRLQDIQIILNRFGIVSSIYNINEEKDVMLPDGRGGEKIYHAKQTYDLHFSRKSLDNFIEFCGGFSDSVKNNKLINLMDNRTKSPYKNQRTTEVVNVEYKGIEPVYDARVEKVHMFEANGLLIHNCFEIGMLPVDIETGNSGFQGCNLTEINGSKTTSKEEFFRACRTATIIGTLQAGYTNFNYLTEETKRIFEREALLGVSITGWMNSPDILFDKEILRAGAKIVKDTNKYVAKLLGINPAARTTCTKPSGNASVLLMTASGIHAEHSPRYLRTVQMNKDQEVAQLIRNTNRYMVEDSVWSADNTDYSIAFPIVSPPNSLFKEQLLGIELLEKVKFAQQYWVEEGTNVELCVDPRIRHNISNTITVPDDKWDEVEQYVFDNKEYFAGISLLSQSGDKDYFQAPFIAVLTPEQIVENYGAGGIFGAGLITDSLRVFPNLWTAISVAKNPSDQSGEQMDNRSDWIRRFNKFADNYFDGNVLKAEYCLKDLYVCHKWEKIQQNFVPVDFVSELKERKYTDIDTLGSQACVGQACEIVF